jgi:hypothetical protein
MKRRGTIGPVLPSTSRGHCGFITSWAVTECYGPAVEHHLFDRPGGSGMFVCADHAAKARAVFAPADLHPVSGECVDPGSEWQLSSARAGFCFVPVEGVVFVSEFEEAGTR